jgi:hypothetical protein
MQELIEEMEYCYKDHNIFLKSTIEKAKELLEKEKEQIIDAYKQACGYEYEYIDDESLTFKEQAEDYYNQNYNNGI